MANAMCHWPWMIFDRSSMQPSKYTSGGTSSPLPSSSCAKVALRDVYVFSHSTWEGDVCVYRRPACSSQLPI